MEPSEHNIISTAQGKSITVSIIGKTKILTWDFPEPLRHPKPLTPSDMHLVLEKEQEAMVSFETQLQDA